MPTCPRCALLAVALAALAFTGCDSNNPGADLTLIEGVYQVEELVFRPSGPGISPVDVGASLDPAVTRFEIFGADGEGEIVFKIRDEGTTRTTLSASASRGRASFRARADDDAAKLARLLLPTQFALTYSADAPGRLTGDFTQTTNLQAFDPVRYQGATSIPGTLTVRLARR